MPPLVERANTVYIYSMTEDLFQNQPQQPAERASDRRVEQLLQQTPGLWRAADCHLQAEPGLSSGHAALDELLPWGGWPPRGLVELISARHGIGELQLLMPLLRHLSRQGQPMLWITPPHPVYAPALLQAGVNTDNIVLIPPQIACRQALWSIEKSLQNRECALVLAWQNWLGGRVIRRLQLAAAEGGTLGMLFQQRATPNSPSTLRLHLQAPTDDNIPGGRRALDVSLLKARGCQRSAPLRVWLDD